MRARRIDVPVGVPTTDLETIARARMRVFCTHRGGLDVGRRLPCLSVPVVLPGCLAGPWPNVSRKRSRESRAQELLVYRNRRERAELNRQRSRSLLEVTLAYGRAETAADFRAVNKLIDLLEANFGISPFGE